MFKRVVSCGVPGCRERAAYKIAAAWSGGRFVELKTYGLTCPGHLRPVYRDAERRRLEYPPSPDEIVGEIGIYRYEPGRPDHDLPRIWNLEKHWGPPRKSWGLVKV